MRPSEIRIGRESPGGRGGVSLGYRKAARGAGSWIGKLVIDGVRREEKIAEADDPGAASAALDYPKAVAAVLGWARQAYAGVEARNAGNRGDAPPTVRSAIEAYIEHRSKNSAHGRDANSRLTKHVLGDDAFASTPLSKVSETTLRKWRAALPASHKPATINRLLNDLRAALNAAAETHRRELPAHLVADIRAGTRAIADATQARRQILRDDEVRRLIEAAFAVEPDGDFGRLVLVAAATGARFSQLAVLTVADLQSEAGRVMVPKSGKGRGAKRHERIAVPIGEDVVERLRPCWLGRPAHAPLLERWRSRQTGPFQWERYERGAWKAASETSRLWGRAVAASSLPDTTVPYALRHSSIVRGLKAGLPVRLVAGLHDTSSSMIERHYAAFIVDAAEELTRRALVSLAPIAASGAAS